MITCLRNNREKCIQPWVLKECTLNLKLRKSHKGTPHLSRCLEGVRRIAIIQGTRMTHSDFRDNRHSPNRILSILRWWFRGLWALRLSERQRDLVLSRKWWMGQETCHRLFGITNQPGSQMMIRKTCRNRRSSVWEIRNRPSQVPLAKCRGLVRWKSSHNP
jgi:hypothetical protein